MKTKSQGKLFVRSLLGAGLALAFTQGASAAEPIKVGAVLSTTGAAQFLGDPAQKTLQLLVDQLNAKGGVLGRKLQLTVYDDGSDANKANAFAKRLVQQDHVDFIIGASTTGSTMAMVPVVQGAKVPTLSVGAAQVIVEPVKPYVFKTPHSDRMAAEKVLKDMKAHGISKFALLSDTGGFGKSGHNETVKLAAALRMTVVTDQFYGEKDTDMTPQLTKIKGTPGVQAVFVFGTGQAPVIITKNFRQLGIKVPLYMSHGQASEEFIKMAGQAGEGVRMPVSALLVADQLAKNDPQRAPAMAYKQAYEPRYHLPVSSFGGYAYDGFMMAVNAIKKVGSTDKAKVRDAIEQTKNYVGVSGYYSMSAKDHMGLDERAFKMAEVHGGKFKEVK